MNKDQLKILAGTYEVPIGTIEKDFAITRLLQIISNFPKTNQMVFKGGTAIKKIYFKDARFSEDIDFTCKEDISNLLFEFLKDRINNNNTNFNEVKCVETKGESRKFSVKYNDINNHANSVKIDLSLREKIITEENNRSVLHIYTDILTEDFKIVTMSLEEIMAEKIRAMIYSRQPRHLYDIWYLLQRGIRLDLNLINKKIGFYNKQFDQIKFEESIEDIHDEWESDLQILLPDTPDFEDVSTIVIQQVSKLNTI